MSLLDRRNAKKCKFKTVSTFANRQATMDGIVGAFKRMLYV